MGNIIPVVEKKDFLRGFLKQYELKRRECAWLLNYLMSDDELMERVHFVEHAECTPKALIISAHGVETTPFSFHKYHHVTTDAEKAFHDIRLNHTEDIYIELHFLGAKAYPPYLAVLENNPYVPENKEIAQENEKLAEKFLDISLLTFKRSQLLAQIDKALDEKNEEKFTKLVLQLEELGKDS
ncbi:ReoY family proteolytic degradation factor [Halalkalibacter urbisdiaboli]|uniref:ReoY family proteolytic degradation factor n=1 Tax=Halalkalibacter urbisdiaboli TaxID=1960589 RepID=UPI000B42D98D|nr:ReoY family proteolytic degradation factor [Halalkalibacter urbisdiaboli]